jgi:hypothetical protein
MLLVTISSESLLLLSWIEGAQCGLTLLKTETDDMRVLWEGLIACPVAALALGPRPSTALQGAHKAIAFVSVLSGDSDASLSSIGTYSIEIISGREVIVKGVGAVHVEGSVKAAATANPTTLIAITSNSMMEVFWNEQQDSVLTLRHRTLSSSVQADVR